MSSPRPFNRLGERQYKNGLPGWRLRPVDPKTGRQLDRVFYGTEQAAVKELAHLEQQLAAKVGPTWAHGDRVTVGQFAPAFLQEYAWKIPPTEKNSGIPRKRSTFKHMKYALMIWVVPALGADTRLVSLTYDSILEAVSNVEGVEGRELSPATRRTIAEKTKRFLQGAVQKGILQTNPAADMPMTWGEGTTGRIVIPDMTEVRKLEEWFKAEGHRTFADLVMVLTYTGLRFGEAAALTRADVDFKNSVIYINKQLTESGGKKELLDTTKTRAGERDVIMLQQARPHLKRLIKQAKKRNSDNIVSGVKGGSISYGNWRKWLTRAKDATGVTYTAHELRHVCISMLIEAGADLETVRKQAGHSSSKVTEEVYRHLWKKNRSKEAKRLSKRVRALEDN